MWDMFSSSVSRKEKFSPTIFHNNSNQEKKENKLSKFQELRRKISSCIADSCNRRIHRTMKQEL